MSSSNGHGIKVLLIDSNEEDRQHWAHRLRMSSDEYVITEASSGTVGLELCQVEQFDCVVTELDLPDMSGFQVLLSLVPLAQRPDKPVIVLTRLVHEMNSPKLALFNGAQACLFQSRTSRDDLDHAIRKAIAAIAQNKTACRSFPPLEWTVFLRTATHSSRSPTRTDADD